MATKLAVDIGNTYIKTAVFKENELKDTNRYRITAKEQKDPPYSPIKNIASNYSIDQAILVSVRQNIDTIQKELSSNYSLITFDTTTPIPIDNQYKTPETLGPDRLVVAIGGNSFFPGQNTLVIDTGTCITFDMVNRQNQYIGGSISPGLKMRLNSLHNFTDQLPLIDIQQVHQYTQTLTDEKTDLVGRSTEDSILMGVYHGWLEEIKGFINHYEQHYKDLNIVITGGDAKQLEPRLKDKIYRIPNLVLYGLNKIADYHVSQEETTEPS